MKKSVFVCFLLIMVFGWAGMASAALTFDLDFGQDGVYEDYWELQPSEFVFIDLYVSGIPAEANGPIVTNILGLAGMGIDIVYDPSAVEITPGTELKMPKIFGSTDFSTPGHIFMLGQAMPAQDGIYGDDILVGTIEFHCIAPTGITELWLYDSDHGAGFDDWGLFDGTVLDADISGGVLLGRINQTPVPGALLLLGSGLLGLAGVKRKLHS
ncbi:hypothetical protein [Desulfobacter latus]|uniref:PEP-CTERM sorting domain-containing protein n=1 Tax=Desulfobacter latus TaxID=2292 RepID=A0A850SRQ5_9BACT|nr:hypothetical protein [Desulfobacter latus]NWH03819.1 hypothetical protein [Desulfobacter latus]